MNEKMKFWMSLLWGVSAILAVVVIFAMVTLAIDGAVGYKIFVVIVSSFFLGGCASATTVWFLCRRKI